MVDPENLQIMKMNRSSTIDIEEVPEMDTEIYCLDDDRDFKHYVRDIKNNVRYSFEYRRFIKFLRENMNMDRCSFLQGITNADGFDIKIEIHHYPFSIEDIIRIVIRKRQYYNESLDVQMVAKEVMELHYKLIIGLIPLSETVHQLFHSGRLFIPVDAVLGRYNLFVEYYEPFCEPEQLDTLKRIEEYSNNQLSDIRNTTIIDQNHVTYNIQNSMYQLPDFSAVNDTMSQQLMNIKNNNYLLPSVKEIKENNDSINRGKPTPLVVFDRSLRDYEKYPEGI